MAITIGNFDGIHWGHRKLLESVRDYCKNEDALGFLLTFDPHPVQILSPEKKHVRLFTLKDQQELVASFGLRGILRQSFSREFSQISAEQFMQDYLLKKIQAQFIAVGSNFHFGAFRSGNKEMLSQFCQQQNIELSLQNQVLINDEVVSTSNIRKYLHQGKPEIAKEFLGRNYYLEGIVVKGEGRGRQLGFPTANIEPEVDFLPAQGVYVCRVSFHTTLGLRSEELRAVMNIGTNKTFHEGDAMPFKFEVHILDFKADLYGQRMKVELLKFLRPEMKFDSKESLKRQIDLDIENARNFRE